MCILISVGCALTAFGAVQPQPGFDLNDVVRQVHVRGGATRADLGAGGFYPVSGQPGNRFPAPGGGQLDGQFLIDTTSALQPAPGCHQNTAVGFDGTNYLVVWENQLGGNYSIISGARVTPQGTVLDPSGILISDAAFERGSPDLCFDGTNFLVVWQDYREGYSYYIYGARITPGGQVLDPVGFAISDGPNDARRPAVGFDGANFLVAWEDYNNNVNHADIYGARVTPSGLVLDTSNLAISVNAHDQWNPAVSFDGANFFVVWCDLVDSTNELIYGARVTPAGVMLDNNGFVISLAPDLQDQPSLSFDGANYLVTWRYVRPFVSTDICGARVTPGGTVLDPYGIRIAESSGVYSGSPAVGFDGANFLVAWNSVTGMAPSYFTIYATRVTPGGVVLDPDTAAIVVAPTVDWAQRHPALGFDGANYLTVWQDERNKPGEPDLYGARVTPGAQVLDPGGFLITQCARGQYAPRVGFDGTNFLTVWEDDRNGYTDIYGARVTPGGTVLDPDGIAICTAPDYQYSPAIAFDGTNFLVTWEDDRSDTTGDIYGARVTVGGQVLDPSGIVISDAPGRQRSPAVGFAGGNYLVVWEDYRSGSSWDLYGTRVSPGGMVLNTDGIAISTAPLYQYLPAIGFDGTNYLVVWEDLRNSGSADIYSTRVTPGGQVLDPNGIAICTAVRRQFSPAIAFDGTNYFIVWEDYRRSDYCDVFGSRVTKQGTVLDTAGIAISKSQYGQFGPAVAYDGTNYLVLWEDCYNAGKPDIYGTRVTQSGSLLDYGRVIPQAGVQSNLAMTRGSGNHLFLVYQSWTGTEGGKIYNTDRIWAAMDPTPGGGIEEMPNAELRMTNSGATIVRGMLLLHESTSPSCLLDIGGRKVLDLQSGVNDVRALAPGVYFVCQRPQVSSCTPQTAQKVVVTR
jgi:hypothetical protein